MLHLASRVVFGSETDKVKNLLTVLLQLDLRLKIPKCTSLHFHYIAIQIRRYSV